MRTSEIITSRAKFAPTLERLIGVSVVFMLMLALVSLMTGRAVAQQSFADLVERVQPAVVNITTNQIIKVPNRGQMRQMPDNIPFGDMLDKFRNNRDDNAEPVERKSAGSGFIIDSEGYVVTNFHVVGEADSITIIMVNGDEYEATMVGGDRLTDLALLKIESEEPFPYVEFGSSSDARIGEWVLAIGNPFQFGSSVSAGIISGRDRVAGDSPYVDYLQTDAAINRGNSGGPLFNMDGEVIGINSQIVTPNGGSVGLGFAIPSDDAARYIKQLRKHGKVHRSWLGVAISDVNEEVVDALGLDIEGGVLIGEVTAGGPAAEGGVEQSDIILAWDGVEVHNTKDLQRAVAMTEVGRNVPVEVIRGGETITLTILTREMPKSEEQGVLGRPTVPDAPEVPQSDVIEGMEISNLTGVFRRKFNVDADVEGVAVVNVKRNSRAAVRGIVPGTVIESVNLRNVEDVEDLLERVEELREEGKEAILLRILRGGRRAHVTIPLKDD